MFWRLKASVDRRAVVSPIKLKFISVMEAMETPVIMGMRER